jgi:hypothetical protein
MMADSAGQSESDVVIAGNLADGRLSAHRLHRRQRDQTGRAGHGLLQQATGR